MGIISRIKESLITANRGNRLIDTDILKNIYKIDKKILAMPFILIIFFLINQRYFLFGIITLFSAVFTYFHSKINRSPFDFKMTILFGLYVTKFYGIHFTLIFFLLSDTLPALIGGEAIRGPSFIFWAWFFIVNLMVYFFPNSSLLVLGPILVVVEAIGSFFINSMFGFPKFLAVVISGFTLIVRIIYFLTVGRILENLFKFLL
ncbi:hypothetical protein GF327_05500 [Candidatus Woesearchaeota archaeon]|nr:hypothetical protein [Candidatus Woesearchaeota archaeon]